MPGWAMVLVRLIGGPLDGDDTEVVWGQDAVTLPVRGTDLDPEGEDVTYRADGEWTLRPPVFRVSH